MMMDNETLDIEAIKARRAAITEGQWFYNSDIAVVWSRYGDEINDCEIVAEPNGGSDDDFGDANGEFIANAPDDIDALLTALEAERAANERLRARVAELEAPVRERIAAQTAEIFREVRKHGNVIGGIAPAVNPAAGQDGD